MAFPILLLLACAIVFEVNFAETALVGSYICSSFCHCLFTGVFRPFTFNAITDMLAFVYHRNIVFVPPIFIFLCSSPECCGLTEQFLAFRVDLSTGLSSIWVCTIFYMVAPGQAFSASALWTFWLGWIFVIWDHPVYHRTFSSILVSAN